MGPGPVRSANAAETYARNALDRACARILNAQNGEQAQTLHAQCFSIGGLVGACLIAESIALAGLIDAARRMPAHDRRRPWTGLGRRVQASLRRGMQHPRDLKLRPQDTPQVRMPAPSLPDLTSGATTTADALAVWNASVDPRGTPVENYLKGRGLELDEAIAGDIVRWFPPRNAMVCLFRSIETDEPQAVSRTFLSYAPVPKKLDRMFLGPVGGAAIKLDHADSGALVAGEGVETCMAARILGLKPCWALGSVGAIRSFPVLASISDLTLLQENDDRSPEAVVACGKRWRAAARSVLINTPALPFKDLNDVLIAWQGRRS